MQLKLVLNLVTGVFCALLATACDNGGGIVTQEPSSSSSSSSSQEVLYGALRNYSAAREMNARLGKGINLGNILESVPEEGAWNRYADGTPYTISQETIDIVKAAGFQSVRIPIRWSHLPRVAGDVVLETFEDRLVRVKEVLGYTQKAGIPAVINIHHFTQLMGAEDAAYMEAEKNHFIEMWTKIAPYFADIPDSMLVFELLNEPTDNATFEVNNELMARVWPVIRASNPTRFIMVEPDNWSKIGSISEMQVPDDNRIILSIHYYEPYELTHAGTGNYLTANSPGCCTERQLAAIDLSFSDLSTYARRYFPDSNGGHVPVNIGEFGASTFQYSTDANKLQDLNAKAEWDRVIVQQAHARGFSWFYWEFCANEFGAYDKETKTWHDVILKALLETP